MSNNTTPNYRKLYEDHYGPVPKDGDGRSFDIHHIDGDRANNSLTNLVAVSIQDHYDIHLSQQDWGACLFISQRMSVSPEEQRLLAKRQADDRVRNGTHHWLGPDANNARVANGTHPFIGSEMNRRMIEEGTHPFLRPGFSSGIQQQRVESGTHHFLGGDLQRRTMNERVQNGTHNFLGGEVQRAANLKMLKEGRHASQKKIKCECCGTIADAANFRRWHGDRCRKLNQSQ